MPVAWCVALLPCRTVAVLHCCRVALLPCRTVAVLRVAVLHYGCAVHCLQAVLALRATDEGAGQATLSFSKAVPRASTAKAGSCSFIRSRRLQSNDVPLFARAHCQ